MIRRYAKKSFTEIPPCAKNAIFITELVTCAFLCSKSIYQKFQKKFSRPLFIIIFMMKILFSGPYSILTGHTKVEAVAYQVLIPICSLSNHPLLPSLTVEAKQNLTSLLRRLQNIEVRIIVNWMNLCNLKSEYKSVMPELGAPP